MDIFEFEFMVIVVAIFGTIVVALIAFCMETMMNRNRDNVPKFRRKLIKTFNEYGIENEVKDEMLYVVKKGCNMKFEFSNGYDGVVNVFMESLLRLEDFDIDSVGELCIERRVNDGLSFGKARFVQKKILSIRNLIPVRKVDNMAKITDLYVDAVNSIYDDLYANKEQLEAHFGEKKDETKTRKIGF